MAGKPLTQTDSKAVAYAIDCLTKNQMADMLIDLAVRQLGVHDPGDGAVLDVIQSWFDPIARVRGDGCVKLRIKYDHFVRASDVVRAKSECPSCLGHGHFTDNGDPSVDRRDRQCLDCRGTGVK